MSDWTHGPKIVRWCGNRDTSTAVELGRVRRRVVPEGRRGRGRAVDPASAALQVALERRGLVDRVKGPPRVLDESAKDAWGGFLSSVAWEIWCTWTFDRPVGHEAGSRAVRRWIGRLEEAREVELERTALEGEAPPDWPGLGWVIAEEKPIGHSWPHWHGLIVGTGSIFLRPHWQWWFRREGMGRFERCTSARGASIYCVKETYLAKGSGDGCEITLSDNLGAWMGAPEPVPVSLHPRWSYVGYHAERVPELEGERRALPPPGVRSVRPAGDVAEVVEVRGEGETLRGRFTWWEDKRGAVWTLGTADARGSAMVRARVSSILDGRWWVTIVDDAGTVLGPFVDAAGAREAAFQWVVSAPESPPRPAFSRSAAPCLPYPRPT